MRKLLLAAVVTVLSVLLGACSSSGASHSSGSSSSTTASGGGSAATITISSFAYSGDLTVSPGEKVTVVNKDSVPHTLTDKATNKFDTGTIAPGASGTFTAPTAAGSYSFGCRIHPEMKGTLVVS